MKRLYILFRKMHPTSSISTRRVEATRRVGKTGFTLVELLVVIALIAFMAAWTIMSSSDNSQTVAIDARDRILNDIVTFKKLSLLEKNDKGAMTFTGTGSGFWATYPTHNIYTLALEGVTTLDGGKTWTFTVQTGSGSQLFNLSGSTMELDYRDSSNTIWTVKPTSTEPGLSSFTIPDTTNPIDQYFSIYFQDPNMPQNKSNEVAFMFLAPRNYNDTPNDDIIMKLLDDHTPAQELSSAKAIFDAYGRMHWEAIKDDSTSDTPSKVSVQLFKRSDPSRILTSFDLPADY